MTSSITIYIISIIRSINDDLENNSEDIIMNNELAWDGILRDVTYIVWCIEMNVRSTFTTTQDAGLVHSYK